MIEKRTAIPICNKKTRSGTSVGGGAEAVPMRQDYGRYRESLHYRYCDCEDRSVLFSILVRDLLGLDVVLLHYPGHLATAVDFGGGVSGDCIDLDDGRYLVCDPTYIGAPVGMAMSDCKRQRAQVYRL